MPLIRKKIYSVSIEGKNASLAAVSCNTRARGRQRALVESCKVRGPLAGSVTPPNRRRGKAAQLWWRCVPAVWRVCLPCEVCLSV